MGNKILELLKNNPATRKLKDIKRAFVGVIWGFVLIIVSFIVLVLSFTSVEEDSKVVEIMDVVSADEAKDQNGMIYIYDKIDSDPISFNYSFCQQGGEFKCQTAVDSKNITDLLYYEVTYQRYEITKEEVKETVKKVVDGVEISEEITKEVYTEEWVDKSTFETWADLKMGDISINPEELDKKLDYEEQEIANVFIANLSAVQTYGRDVSAEVGDTRALLKYVDGGEFSVIGNLKNNEIEDGNPGIISDMNKDELVLSLADDEASQRNFLRILSWVVLFIGFYLISAPALEFIEMIPLVGSAAKGFAVVTAAIVAAIVVVTGILIIKFWYIFVLLAILLVAGSIYGISKALDKGEVAEKVS
jgi:hypothetical protein